MVLQRVGVEERHARAIAEDEAVGGGAVVVGGGEALIVQASRAAGGDDDGLGAGDEVATRFHVEQHRAGSVAVLIEDQLDGGGEVHHRDLAVPDLVAQGAHDLRAGVVRRRVHALAGGAAAVGGDHGAVLGLVKLHAQFVEPLDRAGAIHDQLAQKLGHGRVVAAAKGVEVVLGGRVVGLVGGLDAALGHHRVGVADAQLGDDHYIRAVFMRHDRRGGTRAAAADDEHVHIVVGMLKVEVEAGNAALALQQRAQFDGHLVALVDAHAQRIEAYVAVVRVKFLQKRVLFLGAHAARLHPDARSAGGFHLFNGCEHVLRIHWSSPLTSRFRGCCRAL